ncbi:MAG: hypothetical protein E6G56_08020 [Actinobacteria bacterium]|nr:MAG: hypothetical protein E6G56_08020 [Actinomycetota bacterium]
MTPFVSAGAGFLLAVLWFDLMFDMQVRGTRGPSAVSEESLASIAAYYRRVTTSARPMNRLVAAVMVLTIGAVVAEVLAGDGPSWVAWASLALAGAAVVLAAIHTVPSAVRLGARADPLETQSRLARSIWRDHVFCLAAIASLLALQLGFAPG